MHILTNHQPQSHNLQQLKVNWIIYVRIVEIHFHFEIVFVNLKSMPPFRPDGLITISFRIHGRLDNSIYLKRSQYYLKTTDSDLA